MKLVGLCGPSGSGKTLVGNLFAMHGFLHIDCDKLVHERVYKREDVRNEVANAFGAQMLTPDGVNRPEMGKLIFNDPEKRELLNAIVLKAVKNEVYAILQKENAELALLDAPTLFESGLNQDCDCVIAMLAPRNTCIERIMNRDGISREVATARLDAQKSEAFLRKHCDHVLENNGDIVRLTKQAIHLAESIQKG